MRSGRQHTVKSREDTLEEQNLILTGELYMRSYEQSKPKLLHFVESFGGGVFTYMVDLANQLSENYEVVIAHGFREQTPTNYTSYFKEGIQFITVQNFTRAIRLGQDLKTIIEMKRIVKEVKPEIIHLHSTKAGVLGRIAFRGRKYRLFYTPHGYSFLMDDCNQVKKIVYKAIEKVCGWSRCVTISCSEGEYKESNKLVKRSTFVNNGINIAYLKEVLDKHPVVEKNTRLVVFTLGRICYQKNPVLFNVIAEKLPSVTFLWIGDGELRNKLVSPNIIITGWLSREDALQYSINADIFLLTSIWEGLPISLLEAMYMKKFCVVTDIIGNSDVIHSGVNGYVCRSAEEFVEVIERIQADKGNLEEILERAYGDIVKEYNTKVMAENYREKYQEGIGTVGGVIS